MKAIVSPSTAVGVAAAPPSKSYSHRMLICAALCENGGVVDGVSKSADVAATLKCISALGCGCASGACSRAGGESVALSGIKRDAPRDNITFPCGESGSTLRFFIPISLALSDGGTFTGTKRLIERGVSVYEELFSPVGVSVKKYDDALEFRGKLRPGRYTLRGDVSSQFVTGLLFALPLLDGDSAVDVLPPVESAPYIDITTDTLQSYGVKARRENGRFLYHIKGNQKYERRAATVEGDWSNAAFLFALNELGGKVNVTGLNPSSVQGDKICVETFRRLKKPGALIDLSDTPDLAPAVFAVAAANGVGSCLTGTRRLAIKESDRARAMAEELKKFGVEVICGENDAVVKPCALRPPAETLFSHNDHRIAMALSVLATKTGGVIEGAEAVGKSYADFFETLRSLCVEVKYEDK